MPALRPRVVLAVLSVLSCSAPALAVPVEEAAPAETPTLLSVEVARPTETEAVQWLAPAGRTLQDVLRQWSVAEGWHLVWKTDLSYPLAAGARFEGTYVEAVRSLLAAFEGAAPAPRAALYKGNRVIVVSSYTQEN